MKRLQPSPVLEETIIVKRYSLFNCNFGWRDFSYVYRWPHFFIPAYFENSIRAKVNNVWNRAVRVHFLCRVLTLVVLRLPIRVVNWVRGEPRLFLSRRIVPNYQNERFIISFRKSLIEQRGFYLNRIFTNICWRDQVAVNFEHV